MKKGKLIVTITIGIMCFRLTMLIFMQVKTIKQTDISELELMQESELKSEITALKAKYEETISKIQDTNQKILEYEEAIINGEEASNLLKQELKETEDLLGKNSVNGQGIIIKMSNNSSDTINSNDLLELVNILKNAGAEAISINEQRLVYDTYISDIQGTNYITIKGNAIVAPYTIKAIGNITYLESAVAQKKYGYIDTKISEGKNIVLEKSENITIPAHSDSLEFEYVRGEE